MPNVSIPIAIQRKDEICARLAAGELVREIAADLGVHRMTISHVLADDPDYKLAVTEALDARLDDADAAIRDANDQLSLARAREYASMARWRAERLNPSRWGQVRPQAAPVAVQVNIGTIERRIVRADQIDRPQPPHLANGVEDAE